MNGIESTLIGIVAAIVAVILGCLIVLAIEGWRDRHPRRRQTGAKPVVARVVEYNPRHADRRSRR